MNSGGSASDGHPGAATHLGGGGSGPVELYTLGGVRLYSGGVEITDELAPKHLALLIYLFHEQRPMHPSEIVGLLGRGGTEEVELEGVERAVRWLNKNLPGVQIAMSPDTVQALSGVQLDSREVDDAIDRRDPERVQELYVGDFLDGFRSGSEPFDEWAEKERNRLRRAWSQASLSLARSTESVDHWDTAARWWQVLAERSPLSEEVVAGLIRAHAMANDTDAAAHAYAEYRGLLEQRGIDGPAEAVQQVVTEYQVPILEPTTPTPEPPEPDAAETARAEEPTGTEPQNEQVPETGLGDLGLDEPEIVGSEPSRASGVEGQGPSGSEGPEEWDELVDLATPEEMPVDFDSISQEDGSDALGMESPSDAVMAGGPTSDDEMLPPPDDRDEWDDEDLDVAVIEPTSNLPGTREHHDPQLFTDSAVVHSLLTTWAKITSPRARKRLARYGEQFGQFLVIVWEGLLTGTAAAAAVIWNMIISAPSAGAQAVGALRDMLARRRRRKKEARRAAPPTQKPRPAKREPRAAPEPEPKSETKPSAPPARDQPAPEPVQFEEVERPIPTPRPARETADDEGAGHVGLGALARAVPRRRKRESRRFRKLFRTLAKHRTRALLALLVLTVAAGVFLARDTLLDLFGDVRSTVASTSKPSMPNVSLPDVSMPDVGLPDVNLRPPAFITSSVSKLGELLGGAFLERGGRVLVTDLEDDGDGDLGRALAMALEADLSQSRHLSIVPRERLLTLIAREGASVDASVTSAEAREYAGRLNVAGIVTGAVREGSAGYEIAVRVLDPEGAERYKANAETEAPQLVAAIAEIADNLRRRAGESADSVAQSPAADRVSSPSVDALQSYARARWHYFRGAYGSTTAAAAEAISADTGFARAFQLLGHAQALRGRRVDARAALDAAWRHRDRLGERERLRVEAERHALAGRHSDAVFAYESLFQRYRDDAAALKSQALLQRMIGARGGGEGNLRVAQSIEPVDWPPLERVARFLGYRGRLPTVTPEARDAAEP